MHKDLAHAGEMPPDIHPTWGRISVRQMSARCQRVGAVWHQWHDRLQVGFAKVVNGGRAGNVVDPPRPADDAQHVVLQLQIGSLSP